MAMNQVPTVLFAALPKTTERIPERDVAALGVQILEAAGITTHDARCEGSVSRRVGPERTCGLRGGRTITERWLHWDEGPSFVYEGIGIPLVAQARNEWTVQPEGDQTLLQSQAEVVLKGGVFGRLLEPIVAFQFRRMGPRALAAFKYLVEHGEPPTVKHAKLPAIAPAC